MRSPSWLSWETNVNKNKNSLQSHPVTVAENSSISKQIEEDYMIFKTHMLH